MARLTTTARAAIVSGAPIRQVFKILVPTSSLSLAFATYTFDNGILRDGLKYVTRAGTRKHQVYNPHPQEKPEARAVRWSFVVSNEDGTWHPLHADSWFTHSSYQAKPGQCYIQHELWVQTGPEGSDWEELTDIRFYGRIIEVTYHTIGRASSGLPVTGDATITVEQAGAWETLRRKWNEDDGTKTLVTDGTSGPLTVLV